MDLTDNPPAPATRLVRATGAPRFVGWLALAGVSLIAGVASYFHAYAVVEASGAVPPVSYLVPALADLVILGASADLLAASRSGQSRPRLTMAALGTGIAVTLAMNVAAGSPHDFPKWLVNGWPALAFTLALESLAGLVRRGRGGADAPASPAASDHAEPAEPLTPEALAAALLASASERAVAELLDVPRSRVQALKRRLAGPVAADAEAAPEPSLNGARHDA